MCHILKNNPNWSFAGTENRTRLFFMEGQYVEHCAYLYCYRQLLCSLLHFCVFNRNLYYEELFFQRAGLIRKLQNCQQRVKELQKNSKITDDKVINYLSEKNMKEQLLEFIKMQMTNCERTPHGRRYTPKQKNNCLAMYKHGPKGYRFWEQWCILPDERTLGRYSADMLFKSGVDPNVMEAIKNAVKNWPKKYKYCVIIWDEVSLKEHLDYCHSQDFIEGFVDMGEIRKPDFATHCLTFMVRGIGSSFKQTVGFFYTNGLKSFELVELVKLMIKAVLETGTLSYISFNPFSKYFIELKLS